MPDPFGDNEALSQDALNALMASVGDSESAFAETTSDAAATETAASSDGSNEQAGDVNASADSPAFEEDDELPVSTAAQRSAGSPLKMASFDPAIPAVPSVQTELQGFERVQDIPLELAVELGRTRLLIKDILELRAGSIVELEKMAGEPVDILANGLLVARGEVVVVEDAFGVRITEIITSAERKALEEDPSTAKAA